MAYAASFDERVVLRVDSDVLIGRDAAVGYAVELIGRRPRVNASVHAVIGAAVDQVVCELRLADLAEFPRDGTRATEAEKSAAESICDVIEIRDGRIVELRRYRAAPSNRPGDDGQAALHRVAVLAADGDDSDEVFRAIAAEASALLDGGLTALIRFDQNGLSGIVVAVSGDHAPVGARFSIDENTLAGRVWQSGRPERIDDYTAVPGATSVERLGGRAAVGAPVAVGGRLWGMLGASSPDAPLPVGTEERLSEFARAAAAAISSSAARSELRRLADEQGALRRVAELVALGASETQLFDAVAIEATGLIGGEGANLVRFDGPRTFTIVATSGGPAPVGLQVEIAEDSNGSAAEVLRTHRAARRDDYQLEVGALFEREDFAAGSSVSVPIMVEGRLWGLLGTISEGRRLPDGTEERLEKFAQLVAAAVANSQARAELQQFADEQGALLRVARLVAREVTERELFDVVAVEAAGLIENEATTLVRYEGDRTFTIISTFRGPAAVGTRFTVPADDQGTLDELLRTLRPARLDDYGTTNARLFSQQDYGVGSSVSVPIIVGDRLWGALGTLTTGRQLPPYTEERLEKFVELVAAALANSHARAQLQRLAQEQSALRRVAELVAREASLDEVFAGVSTEASRLLGDMAAALMRYDADGFAAVVAACRSPAPVGLRVPMDDASEIGRLFQSGHRFRVATFENTELENVARELGVGAGVAVPITVEGRVWGALTTSTAGDPLPLWAEDRLEEFASLASAAIANAENKAKLSASRARVVATADETRHRLQRDVHDGAQQRLVQTVLTLKLAQATATPGDATADLIDEALEYAERATTELRNLVHGILPASLSRGGLRAGLESLIADVITPVDLSISAPRLPRDLEVTVYFIVAEALTNVVKHARATHAWVDISVSADTVDIEVRDDGRGGADPLLGSGLTGLFDRVEATEGTLTLTTPPGGGTLLRAEIPLSDPST